MSEFISRNKQKLIKKKNKNYKVLTLNNVSRDKYFIPTISPYSLLLQISSHMRQLAYLSLFFQLGI